MRVLLVPGFAQTGRVWDATIALIGDLPDIVALEIPDEPDFASTALALGGRGGRGLYAGYSMGGRLALYLALEEPELVEHLILVSSGPGIADAGRQTRQTADHELADWIENHSLDEFLDYWAQQPIFSDVPAEDNRRHRLDSPAGIANQLRRLGQGGQPPLWDRLGELRMPITFLVGESDDTYRGIATRAADLVSGPAEIIVVPAAGHGLSHRPRLLADTIAAAASDKDPA